MQELIKYVIQIQRKAYNNGHDNMGASIDVKAAALVILDYFKHLNPSQKALQIELSGIDELKYAKTLCAAANKAVRHYIVTLK